MRSTLLFLILLILFKNVSGQPLKINIDSIPIRTTVEVVVHFNVDTAGKVKNAYVSQHGGGAYDKQAIEVVEKMPDWKPAMNEGKKIEVSYNLPIKFTSDEDGVSFYKKRNFTKALKKFTNQTKTNPDAFYAYFNKALCELQLQLKNEACEDLLIAQKLGDLESLNLKIEICD